MITAKEANELVAQKRIEAVTAEIETEIKKAASAGCIFIQFALPSKHFAQKVCDILLQHGFEVEITPAENRLNIHWGIHAKEPKS